MKPEIIRVEDIKVICAREIGGYSESASKAWGRIMKFAYSNKFMNENVRRIGISHDDPNVTDAEHIRYDACVDIDVDITTEDNLKKQTMLNSSTKELMKILKTPIDFQKNNF